LWCRAAGNATLLLRDILAVSCGQQLGKTVGLLSGTGTFYHKTQDLKRILKRQVIKHEKNNMTV
jgi:hypothetical protein